MAKIVDGQMMDMFYLCETKPRIRMDLISRESYLDFLDSQLEERRVLCVEGEEGVGVTTALALFARRHGSNCASYFNNGWSRHLLSPKAIIRSLLRQLTFFTKAQLDPNEEETTLVNCIFRLNRLTRNKDKFIYFVFDGFDKLPAVYVTQIRDVLAPLFSVDNARFVFSGKVEDLKQLLPDGVEARRDARGQVSGICLN